MTQATFVIGPPGAGKTTIGLAVARSLGLPYKTIDDWTPGKKRMSDADVDLALQLLFEHVGPGKEIVEFCYHDYVGLLARNVYPAFSKSRKLLLLAPLAVCRARNEARASPVADPYVERSWLSCQALLQYDGGGGRIDVVETATASVDAVTTTVIRWIRDGVGGENAT